MQGRIIYIVFCLFIGEALFAQTDLSREEYIMKYAELAMQEMERSGIPASITLAQGCLESNNGNSTLARDGKNHFGIKCHDWTGKKIFHDDDTLDECFRKYRSEKESYLDHTVFLTSKQRYADLFTLKPDDYKGWAQGLKAAGYATSPKYAPLLITIIEDNELYKYDQMVLGESRRVKRRDGQKPSGEITAIRAVPKEKLNNGIPFILARGGETSESLRQELDMYPGEIRRYNELEKGAVLDSGMHVYLKPKRSRAEKGYEEHEVMEGESLWDVAQLYGMKLSSLYRLNNLRKGEEVESGTILQLRKAVRQPRDRVKPEKEKKPTSDEEDDAEMEFHFDG